jgi:hypothetical protein
MVFRTHGVLERFGQGGEIAVSKTAKNIAGSLYYLNKWNASIRKNSF